MKLQRRNKAHPDFSLAAMTDVILLLLIFFMITSSAANQSVLEVKLPKTNTDAADVSDPLWVSITENGLYYIDDVPIEKNLLENEIRERLKTSQRPAFTIRADKNSLHKDVVFLMEIAEKNKYHLAIATVKED
ncbi:MAG: biopolymer transporter ExbD [Bergeyella sp.]|nr:biopolymer transporter ExbD [Bergeyella sp.]